jgi:hypothetical protein
LQHVQATRQSYWSPSCVDVTSRPLARLICLDAKSSVPKTKYTCSITVGTCRQNFRLPEDSPHFLISSRSGHLIRGASSVHGVRRLPDVISWNLEGLGKQRPTCFPCLQTEIIHSSRQGQDADSLADTEPQWVGYHRAHISELHPNYKTVNCTYCQGNE